MVVIKMAEEPLCENYITVCGYGGRCRLDVEKCQFEETQSNCPRYTPRIRKTYKRESIAPRIGNYPSLIPKI